MKYSNKINIYAAHSIQNPPYGKEWKYEMGFSKPARCRSGSDCNAYICMYVCLNIFMLNECMYMCMYMRMYCICMYMYGRCMYVCMHGLCMYVNVYMYVCMY